MPSLFIMHLITVQNRQEIRQSKSGILQQVKVKDAAIITGQIQSGVTQRGFNTDVHSDLSCNYKPTHYSDRCTGYEDTEQSLPRSFLSYL